MDSPIPEERSTLLAKIHGKNTRPGLLVRSMFHRKDLPGKPDIILSKYRTVYPFKAAT